ncbi:hypothetical protein NQ658_06995 [Acinetobacter baumannii]|nr:hypothetical protein [Acinetobacter baumannii]
MSEFKAGDQIVMIEPYAYDDIRVVKELLEEGRVCKTTDGRTLRLSLTSGYMVHRIATPEEIAAGHRIDKPSNSRELEILDKPENHISPNCKVTEAHINEADKLNRLG